MRGDPELGVVLPSSASWGAIRRRACTRAGSSARATCLGGWYGPVLASSSSASRLKTQSRGARAAFSFEFTLLGALPALERGDERLAHPRAQPSLPIELFAAHEQRRQRFGQRAAPGVEALPVRPAL